MRCRVPAAEVLLHTGLFVSCIKLLHQYLPLESIFTHCSLSDDVKQLNGALDETSQKHVDLLRKFLKPKLCRTRQPRRSSSAIGSTAWI